MARRDIDMGAKAVPMSINLEVDPWRAATVALEGCAMARIGKRRNVGCLRPSASRVQR
jgi:hypothetical protein